MTMGMVITWVIGVGAAALSVLGLVKAPQLPAKVISLLMGLLFLATPVTLTVWSVKASKADYTSAHGLKIVKGQINKCPKEQIDQWGNEVVAFWEKIYPKTEVLKKLKGVKVFCLDQEAIGFAGRLVRGVSHGGIIGIGWNGKLDYTKSLFIHETSHHVVMIDKGHDELVHHAYFSEVKLGH